MEPNDDFLRVAEKVLPTDKKLVVGCMAGGRSQRACEILEQVLAISDLTNVRGGFGGARDQSGRWWWPDGATRVSRFPARWATTPTQRVLRGRAGL